MTTFDKHILSRFLTASSLLVVLLVVFFVVLDYVEYIDDFMDRGATIPQIFGTYYLHYIPEIVKLTSPLAVFLAAIYTTARLSQTMQLTALSMAGVSLYRILLPFGLAGVAITIFMLWFNGMIVPRANSTVLSFQYEYYRDVPAEAETSEIYRQISPSSVLTVGFFDPGLETGFRVSLVEFAARQEDQHKHLVRRIDAADMTWSDSSRQWRLRDVVDRIFLADGVQQTDSIAVLDTSLAVLPRDIARSERDAERMTIPETRDYIAALERAGVSRVGRPLVEFHSKLAYPLANLILILIGVPLAARRRRGGHAIHFAIGLFLAFVYLAFQQIAEPFGYAEVVPPALAAWAPHVLFGALAIVIIRHAPN
ncbi:MAG: LptF/LptG family permease [Rubricoccaceae bacterium]|nr:LptF/LptG family permease [Rubricoccaceae bacterium]